MQVAFGLRLTKADIMCDKCVEIDKKISHYRSLALLITDPATMEGIHRLIHDMQAEKLALHPQK
jgi:hypothetical protein